MFMKTRKKVVGVGLSIICFGVIALPNLKSITASALEIDRYGIRQYKGIIKNQAYSWTGTDQKAKVLAEIEISYGKFIGTTESDTGWVQTPQVSYNKVDARGSHLAGIGKYTMNKTSYSFM